MLIKGSNAPKILFIKGIFKKDCLSDDIFEKKILENTIETDTTCDSTDDTILTSTFVNYKKLPSIFTDIESWEKKTNLLCWNCTLQFTSIPVFIPSVIEPITIKNKIEREKSNIQKFSISVYGVFCSFGCTRQFIENHNYSISDKTETINKLRLLHKLFYNNMKMKEMTCYPRPLEMRQYGGDLSIEDFKEQMENIKNSEII